MATAEVVGVIQNDGTILTKGDPTKTPWKCIGCGSMKCFMWQDREGERVVKGYTCCDKMYCPNSYNGFRPQKVKPAPAQSATQLPILPADSNARKEIPIVAGVLDYFPLALAAIAAHSKQGNDKHNPGQPLHWAREKSTDHAECIGRHLIDRGTVDPVDGTRHTRALAWRALALLELEEEALLNSPLPRGAR